MAESKGLYEIILIIYGLSLMFSFIDFIQHNRKANRLAFWLLVMVWLFLTVFLFMKLVKGEGFPIMTLHDGLLFYAWVLMAFSLILNRLFNVHFVIFCMNLFSFFILLMYITTRAQANLLGSGLQLVNELLIVHITLAIVSYGFFTISFLFSAIFMVQYRLLKWKKGFKWISRIGDLKHLDTYSFAAVTLGFPLLLIGIILGFVWAFVTNAIFYWFDWKTIGSMLVLAVYIGYLLLRLIKGYQGKTIALYNIAAFLILLINFFLFSLLSNFHF